MDAFNAVVLAAWAQDLGLADGVIASRGRSHARLVAVLAEAASILFSWGDVVAGRAADEGFRRVLSHNDHPGGPFSAGTPRPLIPADAWGGRPETAPSKSIFSDGAVRLLRAQIAAAGVCASGDCSSPHVRAAIDAALTEPNRNRAALLLDGVRAAAAKAAATMAEAKAAETKTTATKAAEDRRAHAAAQTLSLRPVTASALVSRLDSDSATMPTADRRGRAAWGPAAAPRHLRAALATRAASVAAAATSRESIARGVAAIHGALAAALAEKREAARRARVAALRSDDFGAYLALVRAAATSRISVLLRKTDAYLSALAAKLPAAAQQQGGDASASVSGFTELPQPEAAPVPRPRMLAAGVTLRPYQSQGVAWLAALHRAGLNGILADEMGLGKTLQVIALLAHLLESGESPGPFLVAAPASVLPNWAAEIARFAPGLESGVYAGSAAERAEIWAGLAAGRGRLRCRLVLTSYEMLMGKADRPRLASVAWQYIILDEGHRLKNANCRLNAELRKYSSAHRLLLTGTPVHNDLNELWALLNFLAPDLFGATCDFSGFLADGDPEIGDSPLSEEESLLITSRLHAVLRPFVLRRLKERVVGDLPPKTERLIRCPASAYQDALTARVHAGAATEGVDAPLSSVTNRIMELRLIANHPFLSRLHGPGAEASLAGLGPTGARIAPAHPIPPLVRSCGKLDALDRLLPKLRLSGHKVLLFSTMTKVLDAVEELAEMRSWPVVRLDGGTATAGRAAIVAEFNGVGAGAAAIRPAGAGHEDDPPGPAPGPFLFLLSVRAGGVGLNLQAADTVIMYDTDWNPQMDLQAQARSHRLGQSRHVLVLRLETSGSVEARVRSCAGAKRELADRSVTGGCFDAGDTSPAERRALLEDLLREQTGAAAAGDAEGPLEGGVGPDSASALNAALARSPAELRWFIQEDARRYAAEAAAWERAAGRFPGPSTSTSESESHPRPPPTRLVSPAECASMVAALDAQAATDAADRRARGRGGPWEGSGGDGGVTYGRGKRAHAAEGAMTERFPAI